MEPCARSAALARSKPPRARQRARIARWARPHLWAPPISTTARATRGTQAVVARDARCAPLAPRRPRLGTLRVFLILNPRTNSARRLRGTLRKCAGRVPQVLSPCQRALPLQPAGSTFMNDMIQSYKIRGLQNTILQNKLWIEKGEYQIRKIEQT